ncbi:hypothetical protein GGI07_004727 [Coemansia sp. Benny D115]|nr:hypothetical protein GGI07_004727 [Coemansia sp. Benny D115]
MSALSGSHSAWWYGRAIRLYFLFSLAISVLWLFKIMYFNGSYSSDVILAQPRSNSIDIQNQSTNDQPVLVNEASVLLPAPSREYTLAFTDHIYCVNQKNRLGRKGRMNELLKYMHLDAEMFTKRQSKHIDIWRDMINRGYERALVLEDDVDFEIDAVSVIGKALGALDESDTSWDILYVGHCSIEENKGKPKTAFNRVYRSVHPFCTSGYILNRSGAQKLFAYFVKNMQQTHALDVQIVALLKRKLLSSVSLHPPVVYQRRDLYPSDDGADLKISKLFKNSAWDEARAFVPRLANWTDPLDSEYLDPAYKQIPSWMEDKKTVN